MAIKNQTIEESKNKQGNGKVAHLAVEEASMEKMKAKISENNNKLIGVYDKLNHFLMLINMLFYFYNGLAGSPKTGNT